MDVLIRGKKLRLTASAIIGVGGEAEIYSIGGGEVAKIYKQPSHPDFSADHLAQKMAQFRLDEHQQKLPAFPKGLPAQVIAPTSLVTDVSGKTILGYTMKFLRGTEVLLRYGERKYRESNSISGDDTVNILKDLHTLVQGVHRTSVTIGDFNDLNVLVDSSKKTFLVDADSMQFSKWKSRVFTAKFVDPLLCKLSSGIELVSPHNQSSDWYAYAVMLMQSLLYVGPYGGVHAPSDIKKKLKEWERVLKRVTVFHPEVRYPKPALHFSVLPDDMLEQLHRIFEKDERKEFPEHLLSGVRFTKCLTCGTVHARHSCPSCTQASPSITKEIISGNVEAMKVLDTSGGIVYATSQEGVMRSVFYERGAYHREDGRKIVDGDRDGSIRFRIAGSATVLAKDSQSVVIGADTSRYAFMADMFRDKATVVDANKESVFAIQGGKLIRFDPRDNEYVTTLGSVLQSQTLVWVGDELGFTFSQAGGLTEAHVFRASGKTIGSPVLLPQLKGQLLDATVVFSNDHVWFLVSLDARGVRRNQAFMFDAFGKLVGQAESQRGDDSWLSSIRGKCAHKGQLFCPTDEGIVRVEASNGTLVAVKVFADTARFVDGASKLLFCKDGIYIVEASRIWRLRMK
jgi:H/ACA ribonucleoprotein complex subunit 3